MADRLRLTRSYAGRVLHIRTKPRPSNIGESREVLRLLSQFGEIQYFKNLRYDKVPSQSMLVIFKDAEGARACHQRSGLEFTMGEETEQGSAVSTMSGDTFEARLAPLLSDSYADVDERKATVSHLPKPPPRQNFTPFGDQSQTVESTPRLFQLIANVPSMDMRKHVDMGWFHGHFEPTWRKTPNEDLASRVPVKAMACVDWKQNKRPGEVLKEERAKDEAGSDRWIPLRELHNEYLRNGARPVAGD